MTTQIGINEDLFDVAQPVFRRFLPNIEVIKSSPIRTTVWDIPYTISQLAYLNHQHFRYYGKFPSVVAGQLFEQYPPPSKEHYALDNFAGSGTSLVEAKLRGISCYGLDISWLAILASRVKTTFLDTKLVENALIDILKKIQSGNPVEAPEDSIVDKWFDKKNAEDLESLRSVLLTLDESATKEFLVLAFLAILRRVSKAHDGEVRPHINKSKKQREVISAYAKKVGHMVAKHNEFMQLASTESKSDCYLLDNGDLDSRFDDGLCYLLISHPPYLNSFDYSPVYKIEYFWGKPFEYMVEGADIFDRSAAELKAHPANESVTERYYEHLRRCYGEAYRIQPDGAYLAVVIGDCTRHKVLEPVIDKTINIVEKIGYRLHETNYRTTHYGLGKYAYNHRADYHGEAEKKDGILVFVK